MKQSGPYSWSRKSFKECRRALKKSTIMEKKIHLVLGGGCWGLGGVKGDRRGRRNTDSTRR